MYARIRYFAHWVVDGGWVLLLAVGVTVVFPVLTWILTWGDSPQLPEPWWHH